MFSPNSGRPCAKYPAAAAQAAKVTFMKSGERPIIPHVARAQCDIMTRRRSSSSRVRGTMKDRPTRSPLVGDTYVMSSRRPGSCCMSYSDAMARTPLASPGCVVTSLTRSPRSQTSRCWSWSPLMYCRPVRAPMSGENRPERRPGQLSETRSLQALDEPGDVDDVLVGDETLPRRHRGAGTAVADDAQEILLGALEGAQVRRHRRPVRVGAVALRALREIGRARGAHLRVQRGGRSRAGLREQDAVARENVGHLFRPQLLYR